MSQVAPWVEKERERELRLSEGPPAFPTFPFFPRSFSGSCFKLLLLVAGEAKGKPSKYCFVPPSSCDGHKNLITTRNRNKTMLLLLPSPSHLIPFVCCSEGKLCLGDCAPLRTFISRQLCAYIAVVLSELTGCSLQPRSPHPMSIHVWVYGRRRGTTR